MTGADRVGRPIFCSSSLSLLLLPVVAGCCRCTIRGCLTHRLVTFASQFKNIGCDDGVLRQQSLFVRDDTVGCHVVGEWERGQIGPWRQRRVSGGGCWYCVFVLLVD